VHLVGFIIRICHDARSSECQIGAARSLCGSQACYLLSLANHIFLIGQCVQHCKTTVPSNGIILRYQTQFFFFIILVITLCSTNYKTVINYHRHN
jgi:hypothetical protein